MAIETIKAEKVVGAVLGALQRDVVLPKLVWMDPGGDFAGAKNDTITLSIPATTSARKRTMRSGTTRNRDSLKEGKVALTLDTNLYKDVEITDEELTLDIVDFGRQVLGPIKTAMVEGWEDEIADLMAGASYAQTVSWDATDPHAVFAECGMKLDLARVPRSGRSIVLGSQLAFDAITSDQLRRFDSAGGAATSALQQATVTSLAGFDNIIVAPGLPPEEGYAFHRTAYAASSKVPVVPAGVSWGATLGQNGFAMRAIQDFDSSADGWVNILGFDAFVGSDIVQDHGDFNGSGQWVNAEAPEDDDSDLNFIRAVKITGGGS